MIGARVDGTTQVSLRTLHHHHRLCCTVLPCCCVQLSLISVILNFLLPSILPYYEDWTAPYLVHENSFLRFSTGIQLSYTSACAERRWMLDVICLYASNISSPFVSNIFRCIRYPLLLCSFLSYQLVFQIHCLHPVRLVSWFCDYKFITIADSRPSMHIFHMTLNNYSVDIQNSVLMYVLSTVVRIND